jgi:DNA helicase-2/ATP-dependent DNA helicase PcrA
VDLTKELNPEQKKAVEQIDGPCMIVAGAGSGKTRVLTYKIAYLIESGISPFEILALTFTNKAAGEMKQRIYKLVGKNAGNIWMGTFHSIFARILRVEANFIGFDRNFSIYDEQDSKKLIETVMKEMKLSTENHKADAMLGYIKNLKNKLIFPDAFNFNTENYFERIVARVYPEYQRRLSKNNAMDFDDLLINPIILFDSNPDVLRKYQNRFRFTLVDEYQDTNRAQYHIIKLMSGLHGNISVVGDDAQSIYRWRGAEIENILRFESDFDGCKVFKLEQNYRSTKKILTLADEVIKNNQRQIKKTLFTNNDAGENVVLAETISDRDEAGTVIKWIMNEIHRMKLNFKDFVVLYRTNAQSRVLEDALRINSIPYAIVGGVKFYQRKEVKDVLAYLKIFVNPKDDEAMIRILKLRDGIGDQTVDRLGKFSRENNISICESLLRLFINKEDTDSGRQTRIAKELTALANLVEKYTQVKNGLSPGELSRSLIDELGIIRKLRNEGTEEAAERMYNVQELLSAISEYADTSVNDSTRREEPSLEGFLQQVSLVTDIDTYDDKKNAVTLMTMHSAKGLEYPVVFVTGLEDGIFPLSSSTLTSEEMEEERRLFYVAITRAMKRLYFSYALQRYRYGSPSYQMKSRFLNEIDLRNVIVLKAGSGRTVKQRTRQLPGSSIKYEYFENGEDETELCIQEDRIKKGVVVFHDNFGRGRVVDLSGRGDSRKAQIEFERVGLKHIILKYANLKLG